MLPKVATHLLHSTTRSAVSAVHNQTGTLRNVLTSGPSAAPASAPSKSTKKTPVKPVTIALVSASGSSLASIASAPSASGSQRSGPNSGASAEDSNGGANSQGSGSAKNGGSNSQKARRFYTNYNSASRAVTQANAIIITEDVPGFVPDAGSNQESRRALLKASATPSSTVDAGARRGRLRSSSVNTLLPRNEKEKDGGVMEKISVLKTVQLQARGLHVLSAAAATKPVALSPVADAPSAEQAPASPAVALNNNNDAVEVELVQVEVVAPLSVAADAVTSVPAEDSAARPQSPVSRSMSPKPRTASPLPRPRSVAGRRRNSTSSVHSRSASPLLFVEEPTEVQVHIEQILVRRNSNVAARDAKEAPTPASPSLSASSASELSETSEAPSPTSTRATSVTSEPTQSTKRKARSSSFSGTVKKAPKLSTSATPTDGTQTPRKPSLTPFGKRVSDAKGPVEVAEVVRALLDASSSGQPIPLTTTDFNISIRACLETRVEGESIAPILELYEALLKRGDGKPNFKTYALLIEAFTKRDWEIQRMVVGLGARERGREVRASAGFEVHGGTRGSTEPQIRALKQEADAHFGNAVKLFEAVVEVGGWEVLDLGLYKMLLRSCAAHGNVNAALLVFGQLERKAAGGLGVEKGGRGWWGAASKAKEGGVELSGRVAELNSRTITPDAEVYKFLLQAFTNHGDFHGAEVVFEGFKQKWQEGKVFIGRDGTEIASEIAKRLQVQVWNQMLEMYFRKGEPEMAVDMLDLMLKESSAAAEQDSTWSASTATPTVQPQASIPPLVPAPASSTFTTVIGGFIKMGDVPTAYKWFKRLLQETDSPSQDPFVGIVQGRVMKPDQVAWSLMLDALATEGLITELNEAFTILASSIAPGVVGGRFPEEPMSGEGVKMLRSYRHLAYLANMDVIKTAPHSTPEEVDALLARLQFLQDTVISRTPLKHADSLETSVNRWNFDRRQMVDGLCRMYVKIGALEKGFEVLNGFVGEWVGVLSSIDRESPAWHSPEGPAGVVLDLQNLALGFWERCLEVIPAQPQYWPWSVASGLAVMNTEGLGLKLTPEQAVWLLHSYGLALTHRDPNLVTDARLFGLLLGCAVHVDSQLAQGVPVLQQAGIPEGYMGVPTVTLLQHIASRGIAFDDALADVGVRLEAVDLATRGYEVEASRRFFAGLGETYLGAYEHQGAMRYSALQEQLEEAVAPGALQAQVEERIDMGAVPQVAKSYGSLEQHANLTREIDGTLKNMKLGQEERVGRAYKTFQHALESKGAVPHVPTLGRLIQACGRLGELERVREVYHVSQLVLNNLRNKMNEAKRRELWVLVEDGMIIALAHAGDVEAAHVHRRRVLEYGGYNELMAGTSGSVLAAPSADAYGALILHVKDTTDDASNSLMLWNEAIRVGVAANLYLFNNIISKLSRARKADYALELFHLMKEQGLVPSSITYGAVIGACARVGDVVSAETLFREMVEQSNFKARVPPFNTMMQVYTTTKPNRERALWFYEEMKKMGVQPTAHTYKLLLDLYGSVEPLDVASMESVFEELKKDRRVQLQGTHFASLINAYGCVLKDVEKAIATFESIPSYTANGSPLVADAVVYEATVNALVANRRTDLIPTFMARMTRDQVHMTAYVANFLIKGYANVGDIEQARSIFEGMRDPPTGVAAPNNHAPHEPAGVNESVGVMEPVYREPSTWEAMIRAELGVGNRDKAYELLERLKVRHYPEAVFNRISGVLVDHSSVVVP